MELEGGQCPRVVLRRWRWEACWSRAIHWGGADGTVDVRLVDLFARPVTLRTIGAGTQL